MFSEVGWVLLPSRWASEIVPIIDITVRIVYGIVLCLRLSRRIPSFLRDHFSLKIMIVTIVVMAMRMEKRF